MAVIYLDPIGGNDTNNGTTFELRKRTMNSATTAAALGDEVRVIASPDPVSIGNAQWTDNSGAVTWTNPHNLLVDGCDSGWTAATNVTITYPTSGRMTGSAYMACAVATAFTTGKIAHKAFASPMDFTAFQQLAFFFQISSTSSTLMDIKIAFCSDTAGDVIVDEVNATFTTADITAAAWETVVLDKGSALTASGINSVAIYLNQDPSTSAARTFSFDGIVACKAPTSSFLIDHHTLIGKMKEGEMEWYPIWEISEAGVVIGASLGSTLSVDPPRPYRGTTEGVETFILNPMRTSWSTSEGTITKGSTTAAGLTITGGWDRVGMTTQSGQTWLTSQHDTAGLTWSTSAGNSQVSNIGLAHTTTGLSGIVVTPGTGPFPVVNCLGLIACQTPVSYYTSNSNPYVGYYELNIDTIWGHVNAFRPGNVTGKTYIRRIHGFAETSTSEGALELDNQPEYNSSYLRIDKIDNCATAIYYATAVNVPLSSIALENNTKDFVIAALSGTTTEIHLDNMIDVFAQDTAIATVLNNKNCTLRQTRIGGDPNAHRTVLAGGTVIFESEPTVRHTTSGVAWKLMNRGSVAMNMHRKEGSPRVPLAQAVCAAGSDVTVTCWVYLGACPAGSGFGIMVEPAPGVVLDPVRVEADSGVIGAWNEVELTFTPVGAGVFTIYAYTYGNATSQYAYYDDLTISQV